MSRRSSAALRSRLAEEAARYMGEHGLRDYRVAKEKAAQHLNIPQRAAWPSNQEIDTALRSRQSLFGGEAHHDRQLILRRQALRAMRELEAFSPTLVGAVLDGTAGIGVPVQLHVYAAVAEAVEECLDTRGLACAVTQKRMRCADRSYRYLPCLCFETTDARFEVVIFSPADRGNPALSPVTGKPFRGASLSAVEQLCHALV